MISASGPSLRLQHLFHDLQRVRALTRSVIRNATLYLNVAHNLLVILCCSEEHFAASRDALIPTISRTISTFHINASASPYCEQKCGYGFSRCLSKATPTELPVFSTSISSNQLLVALSRLLYFLHVDLAMASFNYYAMRRPHGRRSEIEYTARTPHLSSYQNRLARDSHTSHVPRLR